MSASFGPSEKWERESLALFHDIILPPATFRNNLDVWIALLSLEYTLAWGCPSYTTWVRILIWKFCDCHNQFVVHQGKEVTSIYWTFQMCPQMVCIESFQFHTVPFCSDLFSVLILLSEKFTQAQISSSFFIPQQHLAEKKSHSYKNGKLEI